MTSNGATVRQVAVGRVPPAAFDLVTMLLSLWMVGGVFVDGWAHINLPSTKETFFTPWHAVLYSGFTAVAAWMAVPIVRDRHRRLAARVPRGYGLGLVGLVVFGAGGVGDGVWHEVFGIEVGIDALLSPTHLLLLTGGLLVLTSPLRAAWHALPTDPTLRQFLPAVLSVTLTTALLAFFFAYAWGGIDVTPATAVPAAALDEHSPGHREAEQVIAAAILARVLTTALLVGPLLVVLRRWHPPPGTATILFTTVSVLVSALSDEAPAALLIAPVAAGVAADAAVALLGARTASRWWVYALASGVALVLWGGHFAALSATRGLGWTPELWGGAVFMGVLTAAGLSVLAFPPPSPSSGRHASHE